MPTNKANREYIQELKKQYISLKRGKESLLNMVDEVEIAESVYNSNAIENSTLTLRDTEKILLEMELSRDVSLKEVFEAKNLARVSEFVQKRSQEAIVDKEIILLLHKMLLDNIDTKISGRFREPGEYVKVANHIAPAPERIESMIEEILEDYNSELDSYFIDRIAKFHLEFENIHPFCDGNGRIGRVLINYQLYRLGFPGLIIRDKEKSSYYMSLAEYDRDQKTRKMEKIIALALIESLHKRLAYLEGKRIIKLTDYARSQGKSTSSVLNMASRQTIAAFREKEVWKIGI